MKIFNKINKKQQIEKWVQWSPVPVSIVIPPWGEHIPKGVYDVKKKVIVINGKQSEKEIIKSIIHEICHHVNGHKVDDPNKWDNEQHCKDVEKQWKKEPEDVEW